MMIRICLVSSGGGHLAELRALRPVYERYDHFYVVNEGAELGPEMVPRTHFIRHAERDWRVLVNLWEAWRILRRERPHIILSTGAGPAVPFGLVGKILGVRMIFIEISTQVTQPSLTGRIIYVLADRFFYQWKGLQSRFPKGTYGGPLLWCS